ncbi:TPA: hypothetical protein P7Q82_001774 [Escherichia coli]|nr:hypothetical protein [Escherichia coli]HDQ1248801.1 hypothetical protein [Escherichia coli]
MSTFTKEQLIEKLKHRISVASGFPESEKAQMDLELARIALASLEAEPVAWLLSGGGAKSHVSFDSGNAYADPLREVTPLYTAPPAPVSVPDEVCWEDVPEEITEDDMALASAWAHGFNQCRAAMLHGAEPVTTDYKLPDDFDFDRFNDVVWLEAVASNPHMHSLTTSTIAMVALELNKRLEAGNSPVIPDGWVAVPVEPTIAILDEFDSIIDYGAEDSKDAWSRLLAAAWIKSLPAAPQLEVK